MYLWTDCGATATVKVKVYLKKWIKRFGPTHVEPRSHSKLLPHNVKAAEATTSVFGFMHSHFAVLSVISMNSPGRTQTDVFSVFACVNIYCALQSGRLEELMICVAVETTTAKQVTSMLVFQ